MLNKIKKTSWLFKLIVGTIAVYVCMAMFAGYKDKSLTAEVKSYCGESHLGKTGQEIKEDAQEKGYEIYEYTLGKVHGITLMKSFMLFSQYSCTIEFEGDTAAKAVYGYSG